MSGVWLFRSSGVNAENKGRGGPSTDKVLVHLPTGQTVSSYTLLEEILIGSRWEKYDDDPNLIQFRRGSSSTDIISLPKDFINFALNNMNDVVVKNPNMFRVQDI